MNETMFRLISTYEMLGSTFKRKVGGSLRMEIFKSQDNQSLYRARIWLQGTYNLYPSELNRDGKGGDLHRTHSEDTIDTEMTTIISNDYTLVTGKYYKSESDFVNYIKSLIEAFFIDEKNIIEE